MGLCGGAWAQTTNPGVAIPAGTSTYVFVATESAAREVCSGAVYTVMGWFELNYDPNTHLAAILEVDIQVSDDPNGTAPDLNAILDLTALPGAAHNDTTINLRGETTAGRSIDLTLSFDGDMVHLSSDEGAVRSRSPRESRYQLDALAWRQHGGEVTIPAGRSTFVFLPDQSTLLQAGGFAGIIQTDYLEGQFELQVDLGVGIGSFVSFDVHPLAGSPVSHGVDPDSALSRVFTVTEWTGTVVNESTIYFHEATLENSCTDVIMTLTFGADAVRLVGDEDPHSLCYDYLYRSIDIIAQRKYGGGTGEPNYPYLIYTAEQLNAIGGEPNDWGRHFRLMADIDLAAYAETEFNVIGPYVNTPFTGVFDGNDHVISNFHYTLPGTARVAYPLPSTENVGLFGVVDDPNAAIRNLSLEAAVIDAPASMAVGGLVGYLRHGTLAQCHVTDAQISGLILAGCLVGRSQGFVTSCSAVGGWVTGNSTLGGLAGSNSGAIVACYATGTVDGGVGLGGLVGINGGDIAACCATGGTVTGGSSLGGLVGHNDATVMDCYATDRVSGGVMVGGLVGRSSGSIHNAYATGAVSGTEDVGGLLGRRLLGQVTGCFWDMETSGQSTSAAGLGRTTRQMQSVSLYRTAGWDLVGETHNGRNDTWLMPDGPNYPRLWWEPSGPDAAD